MSRSSRRGPTGSHDPAALCAGDAADYTAGVADGHACRLSGVAITKLRLIAINDHYSAGYRAGYFDRE